MIKCVWKHFVEIAGIGAVLFCCCDNGTGPKGGTPDNSPALSNVSAPDSVYAGYFRLYDPPDTIRLSFNYNASKVTSIDVSATLDSGKSWIPVATVMPNSSNAATLVWPLNTDADTGHFSFFGFKEGYLKISDNASGASVNSPTFSIIGNRPFILTSPKGGETYSINDSIGLIYSVNTHLTAQIKPCIRPDDSTVQWKALESSTSQTTLTYQRGPIRSFVQKFTLAYFDSTLQWSDKWADHPLQVMLKDYGSGGKIQLSGLITITGY
jgi:hypothetical protein